MYRHFFALFALGTVLGPVLETAAPVPAFATFSKITNAGPPVTDAYLGVGANWGDLTGNGYPDLFSSGAGAYLYRNEGDGTFSSLAGAPVNPNVNRITTVGALGDFDNDGDLDLFRSRWGRVIAGGASLFPLPNQYYRNDLATTGGWVETELTADSAYTSSSTWTDYDNDGDLDLFAGGSNNTLSHFYRNDAGSFDRLDQFPFVKTSAGMIEGWIDFDRDGDQDLYIAQHGATNELYVNMLIETGVADSFFVETGSGLTDDGPATDFSATWADYDNDGDFDVFLPVAAQTDRLFRNDAGTFHQRLDTPLENIAINSSSGSWGDYDNDGDLDLFVPHQVNPIVRSNLYRNEGGGTFTDLPAAAFGDLGLPIDSPQGGEWGDYDRDGDLDIYVLTFTDDGTFSGNPVPNLLYRNEGNANHWLEVKLEGTASNRAGIGTIIDVVADPGGGETKQVRNVFGGVTATAMQPDLVQHFGLGAATTVDSVIVHWTSGTVQVLTNVAADQLLTIVEPNATGVGGAGGASAIPDRRGALENRPNPFNPTTEIRFRMSPGSVAALSIHDVTGRLVRSFEVTAFEQGEQRVIWDGNDEAGVPVASGTYFSRVVVDGRPVTRKMLLVR